MKNLDNENEENLNKNTDGIENIYKNDDNIENNLEYMQDNQIENEQNIQDVQDIKEDVSVLNDISSTEKVEPYTDFETWKKQQENKIHRNLKIRKVAIGSAAAVLIFAVGIFAGNSYIFAENNINSNTIFGDSNTADKPTLKIDNTANIGIGKGLTGEEIYAKVSPSVVSILSENISSQGSGAGSGIIMSDDGYIITNNHVIEGGDKLTVILHDGTNYEAEIIGTDAKTDIAVIKIHPKEKLIPCEFGNSENILVGERAFAIGSPSGIELQNTLTGGYISAINRDVTVEDRVMTLIQTDTSINPGNSGGPLINQYGQVIGINTIKIGISYYEGLGFAIPINSAKEIVDELLVSGYIKGRPAIGISGRNISQASSKQYNMPMGVLVDYVDPRSGSAAGGLKKGDIITGVNGIQTPSMGDINNEKEKFKAGDKIKLNVYRAGRNINIDIVLADEKELESPPVVQENQQTIPQDNFFGIPFFNIP